MSSQNINMRIFHARVSMAENGQPFENTANGLFGRLSQSCHTTQVNYRLRVRTIEESTVLIYGIAASRIMFLLLKPNRVGRWS